MDVTSQRTGGALIVSVEGRVDGANARKFQKAVESVIEDDDRAVILDMESLSYISSAGLRSILLIAKGLQKRNAQFAVCSLQDAIGEVFRIVGFDKIVTIHSSQGEAVSAMGS